MVGLLADVNAEGHLRAVLAVCTSQQWRAFWDYLDVTVHTFRSVGLARSTPDDQLWEWCQSTGTFLFTSNRNAAGPDSLGETIRTRGSIRDLPVLTLSDPDRVLLDRAYAEDVAAKLMEILDEVEHVGGTGRMWLP